MRRALLLVLVLALLGCEQEIDTRYADRGSDSVNGIHVLEHWWGRSLGLRRHVHGDEDLAGLDLLVHVEQDEHGDNGLESLLDEHRPALRGWLRDRAHHLVLLLQDDDLGTWLCRRWAAEATAAVQRRPQDAGQREELVTQAQELDKRALQERCRPDPAPGTRLDHGWFSLRGIAALPGAGSTGPCGGPAPAFLVHHQVLEPPAGATVLWEQDGQVLAASWHLPTGGRMTVITTTQPLLNAALVDPAARAFADRLTTWLSDAGPAAHSAWLMAGSAGNQPPPPNLLALLFLTPPFNIIILHLLVLLLAFVWYRARWLGRIEALEDHRLERFARHIEALAWRLRRSRARRRCLAALAEHHERPAPSPAAAEDIDSALAQAWALHHGDD